MGCPDGPTPRRRATVHRCLTPDRSFAKRTTLDALGLESGCDARWVGIGGAFGHGEFWGRGGVPFALVGHPYQIAADQHALLAALARSPTLRVAVDDRPS